MYSGKSVNSNFSLLVLSVKLSFKSLPEKYKLAFWCFRVCVRGMNIKIPPQISTDFNQDRQHGKQTAAREKQIASDLMQRKTLRC